MGWPASSGYQIPTSNTLLLSRNKALRPPALVPRNHGIEGSVQAVYTGKPTRRWQRHIQRTHRWSNQGCNTHRAHRQQTKVGWNALQNILHRTNRVCTAYAKILPCPPPESNVNAIMIVTQNFIHEQQKLWGLQFYSAVHVYTFIHTRICIYVYMYIYVLVCRYVHVYICICMNIYTYAQIYICICIYVHVCIYTYTDICVYVSIYVYICINKYIYMYIHIYRYMHALNLLQCSAELTPRTGCVYTYHDAYICVYSYLYVYLCCIYVYNIHIYI